LKADLPQFGQVLPELAMPKVACVVDGWVAVAQPRGPSCWLLLDARVLINGRGREGKPPPSVIKNPRAKNWGRVSGGLTPPIEIKTHWLGRSCSRFLRIASSEEKTPGPVTDDSKDLVRENSGLPASGI